MEKTLVKNGKIVSFMPQEPVFGEGNIIIDSGLIADIGKDIKAEKSKEIDASGKYVMPGFVNIHQHLYSSLARGMSLPGEPAKNFPEILEKLWWKLDYALNEEEIYWSAIAGLLDGLRSGVTCIFDHHASLGMIDGSLDIMEKACRDLGIRACLCFETTDRHGDESAKKSIMENARFIKKCRDNNDGMIAAMFGFHAPFTCSDETFDNAAATGLLDAGVHIHVAEDISDVEYNMEKYGKKTVKRLFDHGLLGRKTIAAHCVHIDAGEKELLKSTGTIVAHNPESNMGNAVGCADMVNMVAQGVTMAMGTDGFTGDMIHSLRTANIIHKHNMKDPRVSFMESLNMLTVVNPSITSRFFPKTSGIIARGNYGDIIVMDYQPPTPFDNSTFGGHMIFGLQYGRMEKAIVNGKLIFDNGKSLLIDEEEASAKCQEISKKLWKRLQG